MTNVTNVFNNKKIAVIKDNNIIDVILISSENYESMKDSFIEHFSADLLVEVEENHCSECARVTVGGFYDGIRFYPPKRYPSWVWDEEENDWIAPKSQPQLADGELALWIWNEELLEWENKATPIIE